ncbi:peptide ABC transporter substrate-binding protein [Candidatus Soleaferrea massiliensis]|uniref:peptide ABC transporter substrate-binding protein n=1 Tax=Candidatus Soleaferrea massiliensis TaxID=1470354 RepID=UPI000693432F|nr:peptide ABC transporter substrate-binding protein [Candidatus Soleaferrea massiliensis]
MNARKLIASVLLTAMLFTQTSCGSSNSSGGEIMLYDIAAEPANLDPQLASDEQSLMVVENTFEGLLRADSDGQLEPGVAESYQISEDGKTYTFHLRTDAKWSNGDAVTAHDFVFGFQRILQPDTQCPTAGFYMAIRNASEVYSGSLPPDDLGVSAPDDHTFVVELTHPNPMFLQLTTASAAMPCNEKFFLSTKGRYGLEGDMLIYNGPFYLRGWEHDDYLTLRRNEEYRSEFPATCRGVDISIQTEKTATDRLLSGDTDAATVESEDLEKLQKKGMNVDSFEDATWVLAFNLKDENGLFANQNLRTAFSYSIDREVYTPQLTSYLLPSDGIVPPAVKIGETSYRELAAEDLSPPYAPSEAKTAFAKGMKELGIEKLPKITLLCPEEGPHRYIIGYVMQQWQENLSAYINLEPLPNDELESRLQSGNFEMAVYRIDAQINTPNAPLSYFRQGNPNNIVSYQSSEYDSLLDSAINQDDVDGVVSAYKQAEVMLIGNAVVVPLYYQNLYYVMGSGVTGVRFTPFGGKVYFKYANKS